MLFYISQCYLYHYTLLYVFNCSGCKYNDDFRNGLISLINLPVGISQQHLQTCGIDVELGIQKRVQRGLDSFLLSKWPSLIYHTGTRIHTQSTAGIAGGLSLSLSISLSVESRRTSRKRGIMPGRSRTDGTLIPANAY